VFTLENSENKIKEAARPNEFEIQGGNFKSPKRLNSSPKTSRTMTDSKKC
jgi:hypothetical protein